MQFPKLLLLSTWKLNIAHGANVTELRDLYDNLKGNIRRIKPVFIQQENHGPFSDKLPNVIRLQISRQLGKENWKFKIFAIYQYDDHRDRLCIFKRR